MTTVATSAWVLSTFLSLQESPSFLHLSRGADLESLVRVTIPPCLPSFLALPVFLPVLPFHSPSTRGTTRRNVKLSSLPPRRQAFNIPKRRGPWAPAYVSTEQHLHGFNDNRGSASGRGPTGGDQRQWRLKKKKKTTETESRSTLATVYACTAPGSIPGKICMPTNQIRAVSPAARVSRELRARAPQASRGI